MSLALAVFGAGGLLVGCGGTSAGSSGPPRVGAAAGGLSRSRPVSVGVDAHQVGRLPAPVQAPATAAVGAGVMMVGGLNSADVSLADVVFVTAPGARRIAAVPTAFHDAAAATLNGRGYVFGGGEPSRSQILAIGADGSVATAGQLPSGASDVAAASVGQTAYIAGGYTGASALDTIVAWNGSGTGRVVGRLPQSLRYAAVAADAGRVIIAGGTSGTSASRSVYAFDPLNGRVRQIALLPRGLTHASAVAFGGLVYVIGGRGPTDGSQTREILAIEPATGRVTPAGSLPVAVSDTGAATVGAQIVVVGGRKASGTVSDQVVILKRRAG